MIQSKFTSALGFRYTDYKLVVLIVLRNKINNNNHNKL